MLSGIMFVMQFVDRRDEMLRLHHAMASEEAAFIVVWGRRRVGKTRLLLDWARGEGGIYWVADESSAPIQRRYFSEAIAARLPGFADVEYPDWAALLTRLSREARQARWRGPLVIDELPYLVAASPELPSVLQRVLDHDAKSAKLVIAVAGSSQHMMQGLALDQSSPLYGRANAVLKLAPIPAGYLGKALAIEEPRRIIESYACWGGIPRYWELARPYDVLRDAVDAVVLDPLGPLHDEPSRLLLEETPSATALRPLLDAIGAGVHRVSEIAGRVGQAATSLARPLNRLQELELVTRDIPFGEPERSGKRALYKLADPFLRLWFSVVAPRRSLFLQATRSARLKQFESRQSHLCAMAWEELCRAAVPRLARHLGNVEFGVARRFWHGDGAEWDVVAQAVDADALLVGESKWLDHEPTASEVERIARDLAAKGSVPGTRATEVHLAVFLPQLPRNVPKVGQVHLIDARTVLKVLR